MPPKDVDFCTQSTKIQSLQTRRAAQEGSKAKEMELSRSVAGKTLLFFNVGDTNSE